MIVLCLNVCRLRVLNIMSLAICLKKYTLSKLARLLDIDTASKLALFSVYSLKNDKLTKKQTYTKTETCKLYSRVFLKHFSQMSSKSIVIILSYTISKLARFLRHSVVALFSFMSNKLSK